MAFAIPQTLGKAPSSLGSFKTLWMINCRFPYRLSCRKHIYWTPVCNLITSVKNEKVKLVRALANTSYRRTSKKIVCEGLRYEKKNITMKIQKNRSDWFPMH
jgi:hypothetical protein